MTFYLEHPQLKPNLVEKRLFQIDLASKALQSSALIVVPTGLGKTVIALMVILARLEKGKILFLAPTRPLVEQHANFLRNVMVDEGSVVLMTGETAPDHRSEIWVESKIVVSTPQVVENDLLSRRISLEDVSLVIFDEAHRGVGNYAYVYIAERYGREAINPLVMGITASPGSQGEKIEEICANLGIEKIEIRTEDDPDVAPYVHKKEIEWVKVKVPEELLRLRAALEDALKDKVDDLNQLGMAEQAFGLKNARIDPKASKTELLSFQERLQASISRAPNSAVFKGLSIVAEIMKIKHAVELAETQGTGSLRRYFDRLESEAASRSGSKASRRLLKDARIRAAIESLQHIGIEHPKQAEVLRLLSEQLEAKPDSRIMVFTNYRDTASSLLKAIGNSEGISAVRFVGQSSKQDDQGLSQKKQGEILEKFRAGEYNVLIATSVGEEGIDIPATDMVLFYEPVPSEIRSIQRKGRTGRARAGRVVVLIAKGTRDEAYYWISDRKEKSMQKQIRGLSSGLGGPGGSGGFSKFSTLAETHENSKSRQAKIGGVEDKTGTSNSGSVFVDPREREMGKLLESLGLEITLKTLEVGDYVVSDRIAIERKTAEDFVASVIDPGRDLFGQLSDLARTYDRPVLILEGSNFYSRQVHPNSIRGALAAVAVDFKVPIIPTQNQEDTAQAIAMLARREAAEGREPKVHGRKTARTLKEQQEYLISAIPSVGLAVARNLLKHFGSVENVMIASEEDLQKVDLVGPKIAERIRELVGGNYKG